MRNRAFQFAFVVPCYNCDQTLDRAVNSLIEQERDDDIRCQIILVDDGSTDNTKEKCDEYAREYEDVSVIHKTNGGLVDAWQTGVRHADADYIMFCDSDDYLSCDCAKKIIKIADIYNPDVIIFGICHEYDNGRIVKSDLNIKEGFYSKQRIENEIFPRLLSDGRMQSELLMNTRCNKAFRYELLLDSMEKVPVTVSHDEDTLTCFAVSLRCEKLYVIRDFYPYHYVRTVRSMTGEYSGNILEEINSIYDLMKEIATSENYCYPEQVEMHQYSRIIFLMKKEISKNPNGYKSVKNELELIRESEAFVHGTERRYYSSFLPASKVFVILMIRKWYYPAYLLTRISDRMRRMGV